MHPTKEAGPSPISPARSIMPRQRRSTGAADQDSPEGDSLGENYLSLASSHPGDGGWSEAGTSKSSGQSDGIGEHSELFDLRPSAGAAEALLEPESAPRKASRAGREKSRRGTLVELVRLIMVALFAAGGWEVATRLGHTSTHLVAGIVLGSGVGFVLGGMFGRQTASAVTAVEREFKRIPAAEILAGSIGLALGLVIATLLAWPLFHLPPVAAYPSVAFAYATVGYLGWKAGRVKSDDLFGLFGVKTRAAGTGSGEVTVLDSSAILDGRIGALVGMGFLRGTLLVTRGVLGELQAVADSSNPERRTRGRRALDLLVAMKRDPAVDLILVEDDAASRPDQPIDAQLVRLAKARGGTLLTNDAALVRVAAALDVPARSLHALADALRPPVTAGQKVAVRLTRRGKESGQAVGYLDDGTMVVVEQADHLLGDTVTVSVTNALQTASGQLVFAQVAGDGKGS